MAQLADVTLKVVQHQNGASGTQVVVYDRSGIFSAPRIWWTFRVFGHERCAGPSNIPLAVREACVDMYSISQGGTTLFGHAGWQSWMAAFQHGRQRAIPLTLRPWAMLTLNQPCMQPGKLQAARTDTKQSCRSVCTELECGHIKHHVPCIKAIQRVMHADE